MFVYFSLQHVIEVDENPKTSIRHLVNYGVGVWVSVWKQPSIKLFHSETMKHVQDISIVSPVTNMQRGEHPHPLILNSKQCLISLYINTAQANVKIVRKKEVNIKEQRS